MYLPEKIQESRENILVILAIYFYKTTILNREWFIFSFIRLFYDFINVLELRFIHREMGSFRAENHKQNMEIANLKETVQLQNKTINQHEAAIKTLTTTDIHKLIKNNQPVLSAAIFRRKIPARLLPSAILRGKGRNETNQESPKLFFGPPADCSDLT